MNKFRQLGIDEDILSSIENLGFSEPTEIQQKAIPVVIQKKDLIAGSATGSGKTLAFGAGIIQHIRKGAGLQALILAPTRELAEQISESLKTFAKHKKLTVVSIYGGVSLNPQFSALQKADIVVGTPGRILDHMQRETINLTKVKHLVLDEADRMLDMGFLDDVRRIMSQCPKEKQTLLFSATISQDIRDLSRNFMIEPVNISATPMVDPSKLKQVYYQVSGPLKFSLLYHLLANDTKGGLVMIFCNSRQMVETVAKNLKKNGIDAMGVHGGLSQNRRSDTVSGFNKGKITALVCTDVAARGLDIPGVSHVYNYDIPNDTKQYVHRIGRTARAGKDGLVVNLLSQRDHENFGKVVYDHKDFKIERADPPVVKRIETSAASSNARGNGRGMSRSSFRGGDRQDGRGRDRMRTQGERSRPFERREGGSSASRGPSHGGSSRSSDARPQGSGFRSRGGQGGPSRSSFGSRGSSDNRSHSSDRSRPRMGGNRSNSSNRRD
ncbi:DEAD/DEAH box helicase [Candidatus Woesearchaeota archaeon]|nr:DEAD/DEAH box helicase [Candidatus Woesearchaeota archaeon]